MSKKSSIFCLAESSRYWVLVYEMHISDWSVFHKTRVKYVCQLTLPSIILFLRRVVKEEVSI